jgi:hypothetical protein
MKKMNTDPEEDQHRSRRNQNTINTDPLKQTNENLFLLQKII